MEGKTREAPNEQYYLDVFANSITEISHSLSEISQSLKEITQLPLSVRPSLPVQVTEKRETPAKTAASKPVIKDRHATERCAKFLLEYLTDGKHLFTDTLEDAIKAGFHRTAVYSARSVLCKKGKIAVWKEKTPNGLKPFLGLAGTEPLDLEKAKTDSEPEKVKLDWYADKPKGYKEWDVLTSRLAGAIMDSSPKGKYKTAASVYKEVYEQMTQQYGICWAQMGKEAKASLSRDRVPNRKEVCYLDENAKSIFLAKLEDMYMNLTGKASIIIGNTSYVIQPEKGKYENRPKMSVQDLIRAYLIDLDKNPKEWNKNLNEVYSTMNVNWEDEREKYDDRHHTKTYSLRRARLIEDDDDLYFEFCKTLDSMYEKNTAAVKTA